MPDILAFTRGSTADVWVALNLGTSFGIPQKWSEFFAPGTEKPLVGDVNGDYKADILAFTQGSTADVWVALSNGSSFGIPQKWHDFFAPGSEIPMVADMNGDYKSDLISFTQGDTNDVWISLSNSFGFEPPVKVLDYFAPTPEIPLIGNLEYYNPIPNDLVAFTRGTTADVWVAVGR